MVLKRDVKTIIPSMLLLGKAQRDQGAEKASVEGLLWRADRWLSALPKVTKRWQSKSMSFDDQAGFTKIKRTT